MWTVILYHLLATATIDKWSLLFGARATVRGRGVALDLWMVLASVFVRGHGLERHVSWIPKAHSQDRTLASQGAPRLPGGVLVWSARSKRRLQIRRTEQTWDAREQRGPLQPPRVCLKRTLCPFIWHTHVSFIYEIMFSLIFLWYKK